MEEKATVQIFSRVLGVFGVVSTAFTIFSNLKSIVEFSDFIRWITDQWQELVSRFINYLLRYINIELEVPEAVLLFAILSCGLVVLSSQNFDKAEWTKSFRVVGWVVAALFSSFYFTFVVASAVSEDPRMEDETVQYLGVSLGLSLVASIPVFIQNKAERNKILTIIGVVGMSIALMLAVVMYLFLDDQGTGLIDKVVGFGIFGFTALLVVFVYYVSSPIVVSSRSLSISILLVILLFLNAVSRIVENSGITL